MFKGRKICFLIEAPGTYPSGLDRKVSVIHPDVLSTYYQTSGTWVTD